MVSLKKLAWSLSLILIFSVLVSGCSTNQASETMKEKVELTVSAAVSLTDALTELKTSFEKEHSDVTLTYNFASSGKLVQQIEQGAPVDIFISANQSFMNQLEEKKLIDTATRAEVAKNVIVLITNKENETTVSSFEQLNKDNVQQMAIGDPDSVPAGKYSKQIFESLQLQDALKDKFVLASDVRQVLAYVESGNADFGIVYSSDALISDKVKVIATAKSEWHDPIVYPGAVIAGSKHPDAAKTFMDYLTSKKGKNILSKYGF